MLDGAVDAGAAARAAARTLLAATPVDALSLLPLLADAQSRTPADDLAANLELADLLLDLGQNIAVLERLGRTARQHGGNMRAMVEQRLIRAYRAVGSDDMVRRLERSVATLAPDMKTAAPSAVARRDTDASFEGLFNAYAEHFDAHLTGNLHYCVPELIAGLLAETGVGKGLDILDAGCGTGLCQPMLAPYAGRLDGCDLSLNMLEKARQRGGYGHLWWSDLLAFLPREPDRWDMIVAADVLLYIRDLDAIFRHAAAALRTGGRFVFSLLTTHSAASEQYADGHYRHEDGYIQGLAAGSGLRTQVWRQVVPRYEAGQPLEGRLVMLQKP